MTDALDREAVISAFLARLAVYSHKKDTHYLDEGGTTMNRGEIAHERMGAIEWLAAELGIIDDLKAAGYKSVLD